ncbi:MAG: imelysin family protein [Candidatus Cyclobacteriaceae bacterium M3_2C_046]
MKYPRTIVIFLLFLLAGMLTWQSCDDENGGTSINFDRQQMLINLGGSIILPSYQQLLQSLENLDNSLDQFIDDVNESNLNQVQSDFKNAYLKWQTVSFYDFGPAADELLRTSLNTFPANFIQINNNIQSENYNLDALSNTDAKGFPALDYLLFGLASTNQEILEEYTQSGLSSQRIAYLKDILEDMLGRTRAVAEAWSPQQGNYLQEFTDRDGTDVGSSLGMLFNAYVQHLERFTRDAKIGIPLGIRSLGTPIPNNVEALYSGFSLALASQNITALQNLYLGKGQNDGSGIHDYLEALQAEYNNTSLAITINEQFDQANALLDNVNDPLFMAVTGQAQQVEAAYQALQQLVVLLKVDAASALGILITYQDNDGD